MQWYFALLVVLFLAAAAAAAVYVHAQAGSDARHRAERDAQFAAMTAAKQLDSDIALVKTTTASLAANSQIAAIIAQPKGCTLTFGTTGKADKGHLDLVRADGKVVCSSSPLALGDDYSDLSWFATARTKAGFVAPAGDTANDSRFAVSTAPIPKAGFVAAFYDLVAAGPHLVSLYSGGRPVEFLVLTKDGRRVIARSIDPARWVGRSLAATEVADEGPGVRDDLDGTKRIYKQAPVAATGWHFYAGEEHAAALASTGRLQRRQLTIIGIGLMAVLLAALLIYRGIARPIEQLGSAVRSAGTQSPPVPVSASGPAEVTALGEDINSLISTVDRELTERTRAEEALRSSEESYRQLFEEHPAPMWLFDTDSLRFLAVNSAAIASYGYTRNEFLGMTIEEIRPAEDRAGLREFIEALPDTRTEARVYRHLRKDGTVIDVAVSSSPATFEGHSARIVLAVDVTEQRRLEQQLRQTQKMEAIGNLAGAVAHDFNNVLMVIRTCSSLLLNRLTEARDREDVQHIDQAAQRGAELTHQMLAFSRQQVLHPQSTDLNAVVEETLVLLRRLLGEEVTTTSDLDPEVEPIVVDRGQLTQVIMNLALNARDAMPRGGTLAVRTTNVVLDDAYAAKHAEVTAGRYALLQITDSGTGMDEETKARAFDPFFTTKDTGTGLGLATVYGSVKQSGGHIGLYSEQGMGTTFRVYFPIADVPAKPAPTAPEVTSLAGDETILLVEDEEMIRPLVAEALRSYGYSVHEAENGSAAIELVRRLDEPIDLLLTDVVMPGMNGRELAEKLLAENGGLAVLYTSGYPADTILRHGVADSTVAYIEKPYLLDELGLKVRELLEARAS